MGAELNGKKNFQKKMFQNLGIPSCEVVLSLYTDVDLFFFSFPPCAGSQ